MRKLSIDELQRVSVSEFKSQPKAPIVLVLDNIRSALNVGSAFRTADGFALEKLVLAGITATPPHREILKTAIGATESVEWQYFSTIEEALQHLRVEGYLICLVEQTDKSISLQNFSADWQKPVALVFGNEVTGISEQALPMADLSLEIPQFGSKHSLNVSVCIGIVVWEIFRKWKY